MNYRPEIDGLRALAVIPVVLFHAGFPVFSGGFVGVDVFFVISGYLITSIILKEIDRGQFSFIEFYERRARRLIPALYLTMLLTIPASWFLLAPGHLVDYAESLISTTFFSSNILFWQETNYFAGPADDKPLLHTWSLAVEEQFYIGMPLLLLLLRRSRLAGLCFLAAFSFIIADVLSINKPVANFFLLPSRAWELFVGALLAICTLRPQNRSSMQSGVPLEILCFIGLALIFYSVFEFSAKTPFPGRYALLPVAGTLILLAPGSGATVVGRALSSKPLVWVGLISYSLYLVHQPILSFSRYAFGELSNWLAGLALLFSCMIAFLSWKFVEAPFRSRQKSSRALVFAITLVGAAVFTIVGFVLLSGRGFPDRFENVSDDLTKTPLEHAEYVWGDYDEYLLAEFSDADPRPKMMVIGDSFAKDFRNVLRESGILELYQFSAHHISAACGNLFVKNEADLANLAAPRCRANGGSELPNGRYSDPEVLKLIGEADYIVLASNWAEWTLPYVRDTLQNLNEVADAQVVVVGNKQFEKVHLFKFLNMTIEARAKYRFELNSSFERLNVELSELVKPTVFVDYTSSYCDAKGLCKLFNEEGSLLSYDGGHLTRAGAAELGDVVQKALLNR